MSHFSKCWSHLSTEGASTEADGCPESYGGRFSACSTLRSGISGSVVRDEN